MNDVWDVVVIGAGPGGAASAFYLAFAGLRVLVLEKARKFPRFHIGESLLPLALPVMQEMGVNPADATYAVRKAGARIYSEPDRKSLRISFADVLPGKLPQFAWQVDRAGFDHALLERAKAAGAEVRLGCKAVRAHETAQGVTVTGSFGEIQARYLVDASGQDAFLGKMMACRTLIQGMGKCATFSHFSGVNTPVANQAFAQGDILLLLLPETAWAWVIPLPGRSLSVGVVHRQTPPGTPDQCYQQFLDSSPLLSKMLWGAKSSQPVRRCAGFSYRNRFQGSARMVCLGDAHQFLDPVFSSGVSLAMYGARLFANANAVFMKENAPLELGAWKAHMAHGYNVYERLIERFYRPGWAHTTFFMDNKPPRYITELNTILAGDLWRDDNTWQNQLIAGKRSSLRYQDETVLT